MKKNRLSLSRRRVKRRLKRRRLLSKKIKSKQINMCFPATTIPTFAKVSLNTSDISLTIKDIQS